MDVNFTTKCQLFTTTEDAAICEMDVVQKY